MSPIVRQRTYAIPFDDVWNAAVALVDGGMPRWSLEDSSDQAGFITGTSTTFALHHEDDIYVEIGLDTDAQTTVSLRILSRKKNRELSRNRRAITRFLKRLDQAVGAGPSTILTSPHAAAADS